MGQMGRSFKFCMKEHIVDTTHSDISKLVITKHSFKSKHIIFFYQTKILASSPHYSSHLIWEALEIEKHHNIFNPKDGYKLIQSWKPNIYHLDL